MSRQHLLTVTYWRSIPPYELGLILPKPSYNYYSCSRYEPWRFKTFWKIFTFLFCSCWWERIDIPFSKRIFPSSSTWKDWLQNAHIPLLTSTLNNIKIFFPLFQNLKSDSHLRFLFHFLSFIESNQVLKKFDFFTSHRQNYSVI